MIHLEMKFDQMKYMKDELQKAWRKWKTRRDGKKNHTINISKCNSCQLNWELSILQSRYLISNLFSFSLTLFLYLYIYLCILHDPFVNLLYCPRTCVSFVNFVFCAVHLRTKRLSIWFQVNTFCESLFFMKKRSLTIIKKKNKYTYS